MPAPKNNKFAKGNPGGGAKPVYRKEFANIAYRLCLLGYTNQQIADEFRVSLSAVENWNREHEEFANALMSGKNIADSEIANSLYQRAKGYSHEEDDIRVVSGQIVVTPTMKHYPPDTAAASLWLRNRAPKLWRDKVDVEHSGSVGLDNAPVDELKSALDAILAKLK